jgi:hypothetical protein
MELHLKVKKIAVLDNHIFLEKDVVYKRVDYSVVCSLDEVL